SLGQLRCRFKETIQKTYNKPLIIDKGLAAWNTKAMESKNGPSQETHSPPQTLPPKKSYLPLVLIIFGAIGVVSSLSILFVIIIQLISFDVFPSELFASILFFLVVIIPIIIPVAQIIFGLRLKRAQNNSRIISHKQKTIAILLILSSFVFALLFKFLYIDFFTVSISDDYLLPPAVISSPTPTPDETANWKTYKSEKYKFEFKYPDHWRGYEDSSIPFVQLQQIKNGEVESIAGGITIIEKAKPDNYYSTYLKMYAATSKCPTVAGEIGLSDTTNVYCLTEKELQINDGVWKEAVVCSASVFYGLKEDPETCPHQFWISTKNFFYIVHFNFFEPIIENSEEETFFDQILSTFRFVDAEGSLKPAEAQIPAAGACWDSGIGDIAGLTLNPLPPDNIPTPRCLIVKANQKLQMTNRGVETITVTLGRVQMTIEPGETQTDDNTFGAYLVPGVHSMIISPDGIVGAPGIWLQ
ncbi:MAG: hypothetical protein AAB583_00280, partial [Patescibacteria group bacterium]